MEDIIYINKAQILLRYDDSFPEEIIEKLSSIRDKSSNSEIKLSVNLLIGNIKETKIQFL